jgi:hypothetical protein
MLYFLASFRLRHFHKTLKERTPQIEENPALQVSTRFLLLCAVVDATRQALGDH